MIPTSTRTPMIIEPSVGDNPRNGPDESLMRHEGREYGYVIAGTLGIEIDFEEYELQPGDSIAFDSTRPHRLFNKGDVPVRSIWFVVGWGADSRR